MSLKHTDIAQIIKLIDESTLDEVSIELGDLKIEVRRRGSGDALSIAGSTNAPTRTAAAPPSPPAPPSRPAPEPRDPPAQEAVLASTTRSEGADGLIEVRSPMVGTFYRRPAPDAAPYAEVGATVAPGDRLCLVEVMKLFTTLHAETAGKVVEVCVEDADLVEHEQVLFRLEPA